MSNKNGNICRTVPRISRQTDKLSSLPSLLPHRIFKKCCLCVQNYKDKHLHSAKQREIKAFNPNMHKKRFCPRQNKTPLADTLEKFICHSHFLRISRTSSAHSYSLSDDSPSQESSVLPSQEGLTSHKHLYRFISSPADRTPIQNLPYKIFNKKRHFPLFSHIL